jgi:dihydroorotase
VSTRTQILIKGGKVIDPGNLDANLDILISDGIINEVGVFDQDTTLLMTQRSDTQLIDATGKMVVPGLIDMHVHLREPGHEYKETIESGCQAAACGGFTAVCPMPNTNPVNDNRKVTEYIIEKGNIAGYAHVYPVAAISKGIEGKVLCEYSELKDAGAIAISDDGKPVMDSLIMRKAMENAKEFGLLVISHSEDFNLARGGVMNEGPVSNRMGLAGIPNAAESIMVERDISLCELTEAPLHIAHVSTAESVRAIRDAKKRGLPVTAETAPHYFTLTDEDVEQYDTRAKMNPPLRSADDKAEIIEALVDGTIDAIATDHAPHSIAEKELEFTEAPNGIIGLETSVPVSLKLVENRTLTFMQLIEKMSTNPARILGINNRLKVGNPADITIIDPNLSHKIDSNNFRSLSRNTPFDGWKVKGKAVLTMAQGRITFRDESFS